MSIEKFTFDPLQGTTVIEPPGKGEGYWAGAPSVIFDQPKDRILLYYRFRNPKQRGYKGTIAESQDGKHFEEIWDISKDGLEAHSLERAHLMKLPNGKYRLYISYDPWSTEEFKGWQIDLLEADSIEELKPEERQPVVEPFSKKVGNVKDPYIVEGKNQYKMFVSYHPKDGSSSNTGLTISSDGRNFKWKGDIFPHDTYQWHDGIARITSILKEDSDYYIFYDCEQSMDYSGEEKSTIAVTKNFESFKHPQKGSPVFSSPYGTKSLRYITHLRFNNRLYFYYEFSRENGEHELRMNVI